MLEKDDLVLELALTLYHGVPWLLIRPDEDAFARRHIVQMKPVMESKVAALNARLPGHSRIGGFSITLDPMPRTRLGKLKRFVLPEIVTSLEKRHSTSPVPEGVLEDPAKKEVLRVLKEVTGLDRPVSLSDHLEVDLGLDSLGRIELAGRLEDLTGGPLEEEVFDSVRTVQDLLDIMSGRLVRISGEKADVRILEPDLTEVEKAFIPSRPSTRDGALPLWFQLLHKILRAVFSVVFGIRWPRFSDNGGQWQVTGPGGGRIDWPSSPFVLVANHESYLDGILLSLMLPPAILREVMFWGYSPLFEQGILKKWKNILGVVSIDPEEAVTGLRIGYHLLREGRSLAIFPEGERSLSGSLQTFRPGTGYILSACPVPVIPCAIFGAFKAWPRHRKFPRPATIRLRIRSGHSRRPDRRAVRQPDHRSSGGVRPGLTDFGVESGAAFREWIVAQAGSGCPDPLQFPERLEEGGPGFRWWKGKDHFFPGSGFSVRGETGIPSRGRTRDPESLPG